MPEITKTAEQIEQERMTRRQALGKFGFGAGLSAFLLLGVDDLARTVGAKMQQMAGDNQVAQQIAEEFQSAGVAFASPSSPTISPSNSGCQACRDQYHQGFDACDAAYGACSGCGGKPASVCENAYTLCLRGNQDRFDDCYLRNRC